MRCFQGLNGCCSMDGQHPFLTEPATFGSRVLIRIITHYDCASGLGSNESMWMLVTGAAQVLIPPQSLGTWRYCLMEEVTVFDQIDNLVLSACLGMQPVFNIGDILMCIL
ncbi:hypothetical protein AVEN_13201-1 [Araneus ventricosus]|uniref:Uncharacterized protein n=1 Tax=Araneus ventricosus TaxID=182803 RepID=A0A4Y2WAM8_ARAVE|nr:hypothetical protein AVEN_13201-1 [Araneus ventricosus]